MTPIKHPYCNHTLARPPGTTEEECGDLPIMRTEISGNPVVASFWIPDPDEVERIRQGGPILLTVVGHTHPPLSITALPPEIPATPPSPADGGKPAETGETGRQGPPKGQSGPIRPSLWRRIRLSFAEAWREAIDKEINRAADPPQ